MGVIYLLLLILSILLILAFTVVLRVAFILDTETERFNLTLIWLYPFFKATVENSPSGLLLKIFIFKGKVYEHDLLFGAGGGNISRIRLFRMVKPENIQVNADYGFSDPFLTGVAYGAISVASTNMNMVSLNQNPDFVSGRDYVQMDATAGINLGNMLLKLIRSKTK